MEKPEFRKNFLLLQSATFFQVFVLFYSIEKLFMLSINLTNFQIGLIVALTSVAALIFEFPSGILADRWSRKGTLILANVALIASDLFGYFSAGFFLYAASATAWGIFFAMQSGIYSSLTYDVLLDNKLPDSEYDKYYGRIRIAEGIGLILASISGAVIAEIYGLRSVYVLSVPTAIISTVLLAKFREPKIHRTTQDQISSWQHIVGALKYVKNLALLKLTVLQLVLFSIVFTLGFEFNQLYFVAIGLPVAFFGIGNAMVTASFALGGFIANKLRYNSARSYVFLLVAAPFVAFLQFIIRQEWGIFIPALILILFMAFEVRFSRIAHSQLPSKYRGSITSLANTLGRMVAVPLAILFGWLVGARNYFDAALIIVLIVLISTVIGIKILKRARMEVSSKVQNNLEPSPKL